MEERRFPTITMPHRTSISSRALLPLLAVAAAASALAQYIPPQPQATPSSYPAKPSAAIPMGSLPSAQPTNAPGSPATRDKVPAHRAKVQYADGRLTVEAENSSLNQILREINVQSGIKITGGVNDERVFGVYGPDIPAHILATLLDGTGSNMLFLASQGSFPGELVLTPRIGGPTPPNPNAAALREAEEESTDRPPDAQPRTEVGAPPPVAGPAPANGAPAAAPASTDPSAPTAPPADSTTQQSPNGVKTPQQIYDQLIQLQKQQQTTPP